MDIRTYGPRERLAGEGSSALSDKELLTLILSPGTQRRLVISLLVRFWRLGAQSGKFRGVDLLSLPISLDWGMQRRAESLLRLSLGRSLDPN